MLWLCFKSISFALSRSEMHDCIYHNLVRFFSVPSAQYTCQCHVVGIVKLLKDDCRIQFVIYFFVVVVLLEHISRDQFGLMLCMRI